MFALRRSLISAARPQARTFIASPPTFNVLKDAANKVNEVASKAALGTIETAEQASQTVKENAAPLTDKVKDVSLGL